MTMLLLRRQKLAEDAEPATGNEASRTISARLPARGAGYWTLLEGTELLVVAVGSSLPD